MFLSIKVTLIFLLAYCFRALLVMRFDFLFESTVDSLSKSFNRFFSNEFFKSSFEPEILLLRGFIATPTI